jgi:hypothetical protein
MFQIIFLFGWVHANLLKEQLSKEAVATIFCLLLIACHVSIKRFIRENGFIKASGKRISCNV